MSANDLPNEIRRAAVVTGHYASMMQRKEKLERDVAAAKGRLGMRDKINDILTTLQQRTHSRSVGQFEDMLTAVVRDVIPTEKRVALSLSFERGVPALDIEMEAPGGEREDVLDANGGSITNIISTGLRYAVLARSGKARRKFLVLDEADCWLAPNRVPAYVNVLVQCAEQGGIQSLFVSHHDTLDFDGVNVVELRLKDGIPEAHTIRKTRDWQEGEPGLRELRLENVRRHLDTTIPLFPGVTVLCGPNDSGKSAVIAGLRALAEGDAKDSLIRHGSNDCRVTLEFDNGKQAVMIRQRKGSPKMRWNLHAGEEHLESGSRSDLPDWIAEHVAIAPISGLDVQIGNQKRPIFLLDAPPSQRASLLSVGRESEHLHTLISRYADLVKQDRDTARQGEKELTQLIATLDALTPIMQRMEVSLAALNEADQVSVQLGKQLQSAESLERAWREASDVDARAGKLLSVLAQRPNIPRLTNEDKIGSIQWIGREIKSLHRHAKIHIPAIPEKPELHLVNELIRIGKEWNTLNKRSEITLPTAPAIPNQHPITGMADMGNQIKRLMNEIAATDESIAAISLEKGKAHMALEALHHNGATCPICHR